MKKLDKLWALAKTQFHQFGLLQGLRFLVAEILRKLFDRYNEDTYSYIGEDRTLAVLVNSTGFYVDVGSNHPQACSNTFLLYRKGWQGVCIDANPTLIRAHQRLRKRDIAICAAVSDQEREVVFTEFTNDLVSSIDPAHVNQWKDWTAGGVKSTRTVKARTLASIFDEHKVPKNFDLLSIDVEGHDFEVLSSFDLNLYRPKLVVIEMLDFDFRQASSNRICAYMESHRYKLISYAVLNGYFLDTLWDQSRTVTNNPP